MEIINPVGNVARMEAERLFEKIKGSDTEIYKYRLYTIHRDSKESGRIGTRWEYWNGYVWCDTTMTLLSDGVSLAHTVSCAGKAGREDEKLESRNIGEILKALSPWLAPNEYSFPVPMRNIEDWKTFFDWNDCTIRQEQI